MAEAQAATNGGAESGGGLELHPLAQFELKTYIPIHIGDLNLSFTNSSLWMFIAVAIIFALMTLPTRGRSYVPGRVQAVAEMLYDATANMLHQATGRDGRPYFPLVFTLFTFLLVGNLQGMIPGSFTFTSHLVVTFALALVVFASWKAGRVLLGAWLFGGVTVLQLNLQAAGLAIPVEYLSMSPYLITILVLVIMSADKSRAPGSLGRVFHASQ